jgi:YbbR domain-containing protein
MLKNNSTVKILSIVLAICLWAFVIGEVNPVIKKTVSMIPVELTNVETLADNGLALSSDQEYYTDVVIEGSRSEVNNLKLSDIHATADVYGYAQGQNNISVDVTLPDGIRLKEIKTPSITVKLETLESVFLPVTVEFAGDAGDNLEASAISMMPTEVEVKGAASVVKTVTEVKVQVDVSELSEMRDVYSAEPTAWNKAGKLVKNVTFSARTVDVEAVLYHTKQVPLELKVTGSPDDKYGEAEIIVPKEITVRGTAEYLSRITSITANSVDVSDVTKNKTVKISPHLPYGVELANSSKNIGVKIEFK